MSDPLDHNEDAPDEALIGPGSTATGGGTSQDATTDPTMDPTSDPDRDNHIRPVDRSRSSQVADDRFRSPESPDH
jgi:hypothetical protein